MMVTWPRTNNRTWFEVRFSFNHTTLCLKKTVPRLTCYNLDVHDPIAIIFGKNVTDNARNQTTFSHLTYLVLQHYLAKGETQKTAHWCFVGATYPTAAALSTSFLLNHDPESPKLNALITRVRSCHAHCHAPFQAAATMLSPGEVTATAWLPNCDVVSARQCSYPVSALSGVHLPGKSTVWQR